MFLNLQVAKNHFFSLTTISWDVAAFTFQELLQFMQNMIGNASKFRLKDDECACCNRVVSRLESLYQSSAIVFGSAGSLFSGGLLPSTSMGGSALESTVTLSFFSIVRLLIFRSLTNFCNDACSSRHLDGVHTDSDVIDVLLSMKRAGLVVDSKGLLRKFGATVENELFKILTPDLHDRLVESSVVSNSDGWYSLHQIYEEWNNGHVSSPALLRGASFENFEEEIRKCISSRNHPYFELQSVLKSPQGTLIRVPQHLLFGDMELELVIQTVAYVNSTCQIGIQPSILAVVFAILELTKRLDCVAAADFDSDCFNLVYECFKCYHHIDGDTVRKILLTIFDFGNRSLRTFGREHEDSVLLKYCQAKLKHISASINPQFASDSSNVCPDLEDFSTLISFQTAYCLLLLPFLDSPDSSQPLVFAELTCSDNVVRSRQKLDLPPKLKGPSKAEGGIQVITYDRIELSLDLAGGGAAVDPSKALHECSRIL